MVPETEKRSLEGLGGASDSECNGGNCEGGLPGMCLISLFNVVAAW